MFNVCDLIVYKRNVCKIKDITTIGDKKYYVLVPIDDESLTISIPSDNSLIRNIISKKEAEKIVNKIADIDLINIDNDKLLEQEYKKLLFSGDYEDLIKIIKTTYLRNENRIKNKRKIGEKDDAYFKKAERILYNEFSIAYNMSYDEFKDYIVNKTQENE